MATINCSILKRERLSGTRVEVTYCAPGADGIRYVVIAVSDAETDVVAAIQAHIGQRLAAGQDYLGKPEPAPPVRTVVF